MLHALIQYAQDHHLSAEPGFKPKLIRWLLVFNPKGRFEQVVEQGELESKKNKGKLFEKCPDLTQPEMISAGAGSRHFLVDNLEVVTRLTKETDEKELAKLDAQHRYFTGQLLQAASAQPELKAIAQSLDDPAVLETIREQLQEHSAKPTENVTLAVLDDDGLRILVEESDWHDWWRQFRADLAAKRAGDEQPKRSGKDKPIPQQNTTAMRCLLSGELIEPVKTHGKIEGLSDVGASSMGASLISFDKECFRSYGLEQSANAAMSEPMAATYRATLNHLIRQKSQRLAGAKVVYWYTGQVKPEEDPMRLVIQGIPSFAENEDAQANDDDPLDAPSQASIDRQAELQGLQRAKALLEAIGKGEHPDLGRARFCAMTLSGNAGRVVVRDWMEGSFARLASLINQWVDALRLQSFHPMYEIATPTMERLVTCLLDERRPSQEYKDWIKPIGSARESLWQCAISGIEANRLETVIAHVLLRLRQSMLNGDVAESIDENGQNRKTKRSMWYARLALLKMYCIAKGDKDMLPYLNINHEKPSYHCGRLLAVFQHIQSLSIGKPKSSILDRFYASASSNPGLIIPRIWTVARHHLRNIEPEILREELAALLIEIHGKLEDSIPKALHLYEQSLFQLGFFQQQAYLPRSQGYSRLFQTKNGDQVRSKSEVIIADYLCDQGIRYKYEQNPFIVHDVSRYDIKPDFVMDSSSGRLIVVEHLGMLDRPAYAAKWDQKKKIYSELGILPLEDGGGENGVLVTSNEQDIQNLSDFSGKIKQALAM